MAWRARPGPMPSSNWSTRVQLKSSWGFSRIRKKANKSLMCAASRNRSPPHLTNGMFRRPSSTSRGSELWAARNRTACRVSGIPSSRCSRTRSTTKRFCSSSSAQVTSVGLWLLSLEQNYRSVTPILDAANALMGFAQRRFTKNLWSQRVIVAPPEKCSGNLRIFSTVAPRKL